MASSFLIRLDLGVWCAAIKCKAVRAFHVVKSPAAWSTGRQWAGWGQQEAAVGGRGRAGGGQGQLGGCSGRQVAAQGGQEAAGCGESHMMEVEAGGQLSG